MLLLGDLRSVFIDLLEQRLRVVRTIVLDNLRRIAVVDLGNEFGELAPYGLVELLQELEAARLHEGPSRLHVVGKELGELLQNVLLDLGGRVPEQRLQGLQVRTLGEDGLRIWIWIRIFVL